MYEVLTFLLDNIYIRFGTRLFRQIVGIPVGTNCAPLVADLFLFCYERNFMMSLSVEKRSEVIEAFSSTSRYSDELLNIDNKYFNGLISKTFPSELQLNKENSSETEAPFLDLHLSILDGFILLGWGCSSSSILWCLYLVSPECLVMLLTSALEMNY